jgi:hypothetical protein
LAWLLLSKLGVLRGPDAGADPLVYACCGNLKENQDYKNDRKGAYFLDGGRTFAQDNRLQNVYRFTSSDICAMGWDCKKLEKNAAKIMSARLHLSELFQARMQVSEKFKEQLQETTQNLANADPAMMSHANCKPGGQCPKAITLQFVLEVVRVLAIDFFNGFIGFMNAAVVVLGEVIGYYDDDVNYSSKAATTKEATKKDTKNDTTTKATKTKETASSSPDTSDAASPLNVESISNTLRYIYLLNIYIIKSTSTLLFNLVFRTALMPIVDGLMANSLLGAERTIPVRFIVNIQKGASLFFCLFLMVLFQNFSTSAGVYTAMHGG